MSIIIGGSPSTGSSLLRRMLNRHSQIFCGSETSILSKVPLYNNWNRDKMSLFRSGYNGLVNAGWHHYRGYDLEDDYGVNESELKHIVKQASSFAEFISNWTTLVLTRSGKNIFSEKTPSNAHTLSLYLDHISDSFAVHITRHPLDCIASLVNRGMDYYNAISVYLLNTSAALEIKNHKNARLLKYENLSQNPENTLTVLLQSVGLDYESTMLIPDAKPTGVTQMQGWNYDESATVSSGSIGRFLKLDKNAQELILTGIDVLHSNVYSIGNIRNVSEVLEYEIPQVSHSTSPSKKHIAFYKKSMAIDKWRRLYRQSYYKKRNYPISIISS